MIGKVIGFFIWLMIVPFGADTDIKKAKDRAIKWNHLFFGK